jgi:CRISPR-associated exonuclease Cas4
MPNNDTLPINYLNHLTYCPRRFWLMYVQGEIAINAPMLEGSLQHKRADTPGYETDDKGRTIHRRTWVWHDGLNIAGFADFVEEKRKAESERQKSDTISPSSLVPVEYKHGKRGQWDNDQIQLCAQALCLEEMTGRPIAQGEIFYWRSRRRLTVPIDTDLRRATMAAIELAHTLRQQDTIPTPIENYEQCQYCSLEAICLPREVRRLEN